jgi:zinc transport system permease protein
MIEIISDFFSYDFIRRALLVGGLVSLCAALLGVSLVLKRYSMIGDGLSHVGFGALSIAMALGLAPLQVSVPVVVIAAFLLLKISENGKIKGDAAIALISSSSIAIGVIATSLKNGMNMDVMSYMFGSTLAITDNDAKISIILSIAVLIVFILFYNKLFAVTFDENFAKATGTNAKAFNMMIAFLTAITIVIGMRIMGTMLISSLIIFPALSSMRIFKNFKSVIISSALISIICFIVGIFVSFIYAVPAGASVVIANLIVFLIFWMIGFIIKKR